MTALQLLAVRAPSVPGLSGTVTASQEAPDSPLRHRRKKVVIRASSRSDVANVSPLRQSSSRGSLSRQSSLADDGSGSGSDISPSPSRSFSEQSLEMVGSSASDEAPVQQSIDSSTTTAVTPSDTTPAGTTTTATTTTTTITAPALAEEQLPSVTVPEAVHPAIDIEPQSQQPIAEPASPVDATLAPTAIESVTDAEIESEHAEVVQETENETETETEAESGAPQSIDALPIASTAEEAEPTTAVPVVEEPTQPAVPHTPEATTTTGMPAAEELHHEPAVDIQSAPTSTNVPAAVNDTAHDFKPPEPSVPREVELQMSIEESRRREQEEYDRQEQLRQQQSRTKEQQQPKKPRAPPAAAPAQPEPEASGWGWFSSVVSLGTSASCRSIAQGFTHNNRRGWTQFKR